MNICKINGIEYNVLITALSENFTIMYSENTGRTLGSGARMTLDPLGTAYGHKVTIKRRNGHEAAFDALYREVSKPRYNGVPVEMVHNQDSIAYDAYISSGERAVKRIDAETGKVYWDELSLNIVPMGAQVLPE